MSLSDRGAAYVRTLWPLLVGHVVAYVLIRARAFGLPVDEALVTEAVAFVAAGVVYSLGRWLEARIGEGLLSRAARGAGRFLLSLGLDTGQPVYGLPPAQTETEVEYDPDGTLLVTRSVTRWPRPGTPPPPSLTEMFMPPPRRRHDDPDPRL